MFITVRKYWYVLVILLIVTAAILWIRGDGCGKVKSYFGGDPIAGVPEDAVLIPIIEDTYTIAERVNPFHKQTRAEELTKDLPSGTEVYEINGEGLIYRTPAGTILKSGELEVVAYRAPERFIAAEFRPKLIATTDFTTGGGGVEIDLVRIGDFHGGPACGVNLDSSVWGGAGIGYNAWKNIDVGAFGGYGTRGATYGISVGIAIQ